MTESDIKHWRDYALTAAHNKGLKGDDKEDAAQEALVDLIAAWDKAVGDMDARAKYYARVVANAVLMFLRSRGPRMLELQDGINEGAEDDGDTPREQRNDWLAYDPYGAADNAIDAEAEVTALLPELSELSPYQWDVMRRTAEGYTTAEIAEQLGRSYCSVESTRRDVRRKFV